MKSTKKTRPIWKNGRVWPRPRSIPVVDDGGVKVFLDGLVVVPSMSRNIYFFRSAGFSV